MTAPSFRVYIVRHGGDSPKVSATLLRHAQRLFDSPPPAAIAESEDEVYADLARQVAALRADDEDLDRYLWSEDLELRKVDVEVHPRSVIGSGAGAVQVIGASPIPLRVAFASSPLPRGGHRVVVPRFGWSLVLEDLAIAADTLRALIATALVGESPAWIYDFRREVDESIAVWHPDQLARWAAPSSATAEEPAPPTLDQVAEDWVRRAERRTLPPVLGVDAVFDAHAAGLLGDRARSVLLVGPSGTGKTAFVRRLARRLLEHGRVTRDRVRLWATSADRILAGMAYLGMWQERCLTLVRELTAAGDWLYVDRLVDLVRPQSDGASIADLLAPAVIASEVRLIAECDEAELVRCRQRHPALVDAMQVIRVDELAPAHVLPLLAVYQQRKDAGSELHPQAARRLVQLLAAFRRDVRFPGKALGFLDWWHTQPSRPTLVMPRDIVAAFSRWSGLPVELIADEHPAGADDIAAELRRGVIGQDAACDVAARVLSRFKAGLDDPERPVGTLFFAGPTGVGKTELAKRIAGYMFGSTDRLVRVDMSEYMAPGSSARLLEVAGGRSLAERVRQGPLCVVLLDEVEKAHPEVFDLLLGVLGEGRLTDSLGRLVDFRMAVIVMTSNLGTHKARASGFAASDSASLGAIRQHFRPELFARLDHVVAFRALAPADIERIVDLELDKVRRRPGLAQRGLTLSVSAAARAALAVRGFDARLGARPLRRLIEEAVVAPLAVHMAADPELRDRAVAVRVDGEDAPAGALVIGIAAPG